MELLLFLLIIAGIGAADYQSTQHNETRAQDNIIAKEEADRVSRHITTIIMEDSDWVDNKGVDAFRFEADTDGYFPLSLHDASRYKNIVNDDDNNITTTVWMHTPNSDTMNLIISSRFATGSYALTTSIERYPIGNYIPIVLGNSLSIKESVFSSYAYNSYYHTTECMSAPRVNIAYPLHSNISDIQFKIPRKPCGYDIKNISLFFQEGAQVEDSSYVNDVYAKESGRYLINAKTATNYHFPVVKTMPVHHITTPAQEEQHRVCAEGELIHINNGSLSSLTVEQGCNAISLDGNSFHIGTLEVRAGAIANFDFSGTVSLKIGTVESAPFSRIYFESRNSDTDHISLISESLLIGENRSVYNGEIQGVIEGGGHAVFECRHPQTCLFDTNRLIVLHNSSFSGMSIVRDLAVIKNSAFNGALLSYNAHIKNSSLSNIIDDQGNQVISDAFLQMFDTYTESDEETVTTYKYFKSKQCDDFTDCKTVAHRIR